MRLALTLLSVAAFAPGADVEHWKGADLRAMDKKLAPRLNAVKFGSERLGTWGNHLLMVGHRQGDGEAELHELQTDVFIVQSGEGTLVYGGAVDQAKTTAPNEVRGPSIRDGRRLALAPGDIVHIPARTPHQVLVAKGKQITYAVLKVE